MPENSKILLTMDNCPAHPSAESLQKDDIIVSFLPPNCTSILQPMDMGVLRALKCHYKSDFVKGLLQFLNTNDTVISYVKQFTIKDAIWNIARAWDSISSEILKNSWHNLFPLALFSTYVSTEDNVSTFEGFNTKNNDDISELLKYARSTSDKILLDEEDLEELMNVDTEAPITNRLSDDELLHSVLGTQEESQSEEEEDGPEKHEKMSIDNLIAVMDTAIKGLEERNFITEHELMLMHKIKDKLINEKPKLMKQKTLTEMFKLKE